MYVPTADNPADLGSRGAQLKTPNCGATVQNGCTVVISGLGGQRKCRITAAEAKVIREVIAVATVAEADEFADLLAKHNLKRA